MLPTSLWTGTATESAGPAEGAGTASVWLARRGTIGRGVIGEFASVILNRAALRANPGTTSRFQIACKTRALFQGSWSMTRGGGTPPYGIRALLIRRPAKL